LINILVPAGVTMGPSFARFRLSTVSGLGPNDTPRNASGDILAGEIEDYSIIIQPNKFQNPLNTADVNKSGVVTPLDALNVINLLSEYRRIPGSPPGFIDLTMPDTFSTMTTLVDGTYLPDVDGNGMVTPLDALRVINRIAAQRRVGQGQGEGESFTDVGSGVLASPLTIATSQPFANAAGVNLSVASPIAKVALATPTSIFDSPQVTALDDILDDLVSDRLIAERDGGASVDVVFSGLGLGL